jgi:hypothetical protein
MLTKVQLILLMSKATVLSTFCCVQEKLELSNQPLTTQLKHSLLGKLYKHILFQQGWYKEKQ